MSESACDRILARECVQRRLACLVGVSSIRATVRSPEAWIASVEDTKRMKPTDKAILGMVSKSPGRNASEPTGGLDKKWNPEAEPSVSGRRQHGVTWADRDVTTLRRGGRDSTVTSACRATGETVLVPLAQAGEQGRPYNRQHREIGWRRDGGG